ncbi:MAG: hypothetical protein R3293_23865 [Candidatus Promineifilaceae bacterium]|nr:hypothetical protein [Candidatus Promineifilaceae bacterium]
MALRAAHARDKSQGNQERRRPSASPAGPPLPAKPEVDLTRLIKELPPHLGWENAAITSAVRKTVGQNCILSNRQAASLPYTGPDSDSDCDCDCDCEIAEEWSEVKLHPGIGLGMLAAKRAASGRIWLLLRAIDTSGKGWLSLKTVRQQLAGQDAPLRVCGPRHLRNLLAQGEKIFWEKRDERLWLRSVPRAAAALGVQRLDGRPVAIPRQVLLGRIGAVRAHFYAAFHSGRKKANPISRAALTRISQVSPRSQQNYERRAGVRKQRNFAVGPRLNSARAQETAWQKGPACFPWHDHQALHGSTTAVFLAWQLPNSYNGPHEQRSNGNRKKFNRQLADLSHKGMTGNGRPALEQLYCATAKAAVISANNSEAAVYWRGNRPQLWHVIERSGT